MNRRQTLRYAAKASVPVMAGYIVLGAGFGILLQSKGYSWWWAAAMSLFIYEGSMQYVAIDLLGNVLPFAIMGMLVVYCLREINFPGKSHGIPVAVSVLFVVHSRARSRYE